MNKKAFSLIELSIVLLIIGIIITGITQSSRLITAFRLSNARTLSNSSPVSSIEGLILWLDATNEKAIAESEAADGVAISSWKSTNPQSANLKEFTSSSTARPTYDEDGINGLPSLNFDGTNDYFQSDYDPDLNPEKFTFFIIAKGIDNDALQTPFSLRDWNGSVVRGFILYLGLDSGNVMGYEFLFGNNTGTWTNSQSEDGDITFKENHTQLITATYDGITYKTYDDGNTTPNYSETGTFANNNSAVQRIGASMNETTADYFFKGHIGEIIYFNRALKNEEQQAIEQYLIKKWGVID